MTTPDRAAELRRFTGTPPAVPAQPLTPTQLSAADLTGMSPAQIVAAQAEGRCDALLGTRTDAPWVPSDRQLSAADLTEMTPAQIVAAQQAGQCSDLMTGKTTAPPNKENP